MVIEKWFNQIHCVSCFINITSVLFPHDLTIENSRHNVLANLLCLFGVHLVLEKGFEQKHCVNKLFYNCLGLFYNFTSRLIRNYKLANLLRWVGIHLLIEEWLKQTHCVRYFTQIHLICFMIWPVHKAETMYYLNYCVDCGNTRSLKSYSIRYTVLGVSPRLILFFCMIWPLKNLTPCVS